MQGRRSKRPRVIWFAGIVALSLSVTATAYAQPVTRSSRHVIRPPQLNGEYHRAEAAWKSGTSLREAKIRLDRVLEALPDDPKARKLRAQVLLALGKPKAALADALRAVTLDPEDGETFVILCEAARRSGDLARADWALDAASKRILEGAALHVRLSWNAVALERLDEAEAFARIALAQDPRMKAAYEQLARVFVLKNKPDAAATILAQGFDAGLLDAHAVRADTLLGTLAGHPKLEKWMQ